MDRKRVWRYQRSNQNP